MASRKIEDLNDDIKDKCLSFKESCKQAGIDILITCTLRSLDEQKALYAQGRQPLEEVNRLRKLVKLAPILDKENKKKVTNAKPGMSKHNPDKDNKSAAFDIVIMENGKPIWSTSNPNWLVVGEIGRHCGLIWAGDFKTFKEYPHFEV